MIVVKPKKPKPKPVAAPPGQFTTPDMKAWQAQAQRMGAAGAVQPNGFTAADNAAIQKWGANMTAGRPLLAGAPGGPPAAPAPAANPRDSQYFADLATGQHARDQTRAGLQQAQGYDQADFAEALRRMHDARPREEVGAKVGANKQGLFYSSTLGNQLADIGTSYQRQENDAQSAFDRRKGERDSQLADLPTDEAISAEALRAAIGRAIGNDTTAADQGALAAPAPAAAAAPAGQTVTRASAAHGGQRWKFRVRPSDGKLIPIGPA